MSRAFYSDGYRIGSSGVKTGKGLHRMVEGLNMSHMEILMTRLDDNSQQQTDEEIHAVLAEVPWAREALYTYLISHRRELHNDVLAMIDEMLSTPA